jgi:hypothetical protein
VLAEGLPFFGWASERIHRCVPGHFINRGRTRYNKHRGDCQSSGSTLRIPSISSTYCCSALARASSRYLGSRSEVLLNSKMKRDFLSRFMATRSKRRRCRARYQHGRHISCSFLSSSLAPLHRQQVTSPAVIPGRALIH